MICFLTNIRFHIRILQAIPEMGDFIYTISPFKRLWQLGNL